MSAHAVVVGIHALAALLALVAGIVAVHTGRGFRWHQGGVVVMAVALPASLALSWAAFPTPARGAFVGLTVLAGVMVVQALRAGRVRAVEVAVTGRTSPGPEFVRVAGFNLVALTVAGTVVPVLRAGGGAVGIAVAVGVTVGLGHLLVERRRLRVAT